MWYKEARSDIGEMYSWLTPGPPCRQTRGRMLEFRSPKSLYQVLHGFWAVGTG